MTRRTKGVLLLGWACLPLAWGVDKLAAALGPDTIEGTYTRPIYLPMAQGIGSLADRIPISIGELIMGGLILTIVAGFIRGASRIRRGDGSLGGQLLTWTAWLGAGAGFLLFLFQIMWGVNIHRTPLPEQLGLTIKPASPGEVLALTQHLAAQCIELAEAVPRGADGRVEFPGGLVAMGYGAQAGYDALAGSLPQVGGLYAHPKAFISSTLFAYLGIAGMYFPYTFEAQLNHHIPRASLPFTACHEMAHQRGYVREDEANFVGFLACEAHPAPLYQYAAAFNGLLYTLGALNKADPEAYGPLYRGLSPTVKGDLDTLRAYRERFDTRIATGFSKVHDASLKVQGQSAGVQTYGKVVDLLLARQRLQRAPSSNKD